MACYCTSMVDDPRLLGTLGEFKAFWDPRRFFHLGGLPVSSGGYTTYRRFVFHKPQPT